MRFRCRLFAFAVVCAIVTHKAEASPIIFTDRALFESYTATLPGLPPLTLETFDNPWWTFDFVFDSCVMHLTGLVIGHDCHDSAIGPGTGTFGNAVFPAHTFGAGAQFFLPQTALGFDYVAGGAVPFHFMGLSFLLTGAGFLGVVDTTQPSLGMGTLQQPFPLSGALVMDNLLMRVPEPSTALLFGSAFALLQVVRYRRRSSHSQ
jgi:hypothetical protein